MSGFAIDLSADMIGDGDLLLSRTALRAAGRGGRQSPVPCERPMAIIGKSGLLATRAAKR
jgi:hypothetical protein